MEPSEILEQCYNTAQARLDHPIVEGVSSDLQAIVDSRNRSPVRFLMACLLAKVHQPSVDIRKPYTEIGDNDSYSGRTYDERYITPFILKYKLPCDPTTAFLTPAFRTLNIPLTQDVELQGKPKEVYRKVIDILNLVQLAQLDPKELLSELIRRLILLREQRQQQLAQLHREVELSKDVEQFSVEKITNLLKQHLSCPHSSRLPVLILRAAYNTVHDLINKQVGAIHPHTAADKATGAAGDIEITLLNTGDIVLIYEVKAKKLTVEDIQLAVQKLDRVSLPHQPSQYVLITTEPVDEFLHSAAAELYEKTGVEFMILDCLGFVKHFLHLFYERRMSFLDEYQKLVIDEPENAVSHELKLAFLALRLALSSPSASEDEME